MLFLVTGAAGFIGSNLVGYLLSHNYNVRGLDNFITGHQKNINPYLSHPNFQFIQGDIRDFHQCQEACKDVTYVLHQAALGSVPRSMKEPLLYVENNIKGTSNMMESAKLSGVKRFIYASSSSVYGDSVDLPKVEGCEGNVLSPYALSKKVNEEYGALYTHVYGLPCIGLRYFNVFGPHQDEHSTYAAVIPKFIKAMLSNEPIIIHGDGKQSRDFTYIQNVVEANLLASLADEKACGKAYNIACGNRYTLNKIVDLLENELTPINRAIYGPPRPGDVKHSLASIKEAQNYLDYEGKWSFKEGLKETIQWYKKSYNIKKP